MQCADLALLVLGQLQTTTIRIFCEMVSEYVPASLENEFANLGTTSN